MVIHKKAKTDITKLIIARKLPASAKVSQGLHCLLHLAKPNCLENKCLSKYNFKIDRDSNETNIISHHNSQS